MDYYFIVQETIDGKDQYYATKDGDKKTENESFAYQYKYKEDAEKAIRGNKYNILGDDILGDNSIFQIIPVCTLQFKERNKVLYNDPKEVKWEEGVRFLSLEDFINQTGLPSSCIVKEVSNANNLILVKNEQTNREQWMRLEDIDEIEILPFKRNNCI